MMEGETRTVTVDGKSVRCVLATDWLLGRDTYFSNVSFQ